MPPRRALFPFFALFEIFPAGSCAAFRFAVLFSAPSQPFRSKRSVVRCSEVTADDQIERARARLCAMAIRRRTPPVARGATTTTTTTTTSVPATPLRSSHVLAVTAAALLLLAAAGCARDAGELLADVLRFLSVPTNPSRLQWPLRVFVLGDPYRRYGRFFFVFADDHSSSSGRGLVRSSCPDVHHHPSVQSRYRFYFLDERFVSKTPAPRV